MTLDRNSTRDILVKLVTGRKGFIKICDFVRLCTFKIMALKADPENLAKQARGIRARYHYYTHLLAPQAGTNLFYTYTSHFF